MKILVALFLSVLSVGAYANDSESGGSLVQAVKARLTCEDMSARLKELTALEDPQDYDLEEIEQFKADYRRSCVKISKKRRSSVAKNKSQLLQKRKQKLLFQKQTWSPKN